LVEELVSKTKELELEHPTAENAKSPHQTWRILFLDSVENIEQLKRACKDAGYVVVGSNTIRDAWTFLDGKDHVDVIVCAAYLEGESMFEFLKSVRDNKIHSAAMFLILSLDPGATGARLDRSTRSAAMALGADGYVIMPTFDPCELVAQIRHLQPNIPMLQQCDTPAEKRRSE
jgi:CheY-like chemotaxis protein